MNFSIIIPTWNRCASLRRTLASLAALDGQGIDYEILVVDNGSADATHEVFDEARALHRGLTWRFYDEPMPGLLSGRHRGALEAVGDVCAFLDDDVRVGQDWLNGLRDAFGQTDVMLAGGPSVASFECQPPQWLESFYTERSIGRTCGWLSVLEGGQAKKAIDPVFVWGLNFAIRRKALVDLGGFHPDCLPPQLQRYQGDGETGLATKLRNAGFSAVYHPDIAVTHEIPAARLTVEYFEQRARYQGVCDSYTAIRREQLRDHGVKASSGRQPRGRLREIVSRVAEKSPLELTRAVGHRILGLGRSTILNSRSTPPAFASSEVRAIRARADAAYRDGFAFHQAEVAADSALLEWVRRATYWDYRLPAGWESYMRPAQPRRSDVAGSLTC